MFAVTQEATLNIGLQGFYYVINPTQGHRFYLYIRVAERKARPGGALDMVRIRTIEQRKAL